MARLTDDQNVLLARAVKDVAGELMAGEDGEPLRLRGSGKYDLELCAALWAAIVSEGWPDGDAEKVFVGLGVEVGETTLLKIKQKGAAGPWEKLAEALPFGRGQLKVLRRRLQKFAPAEIPEHPLATDVDYAAPLRAPDWIVEPYWAKGQRTHASGKKSSAKSSLAFAWVAAGVTGGTSLGRPVNASRFLIVSGEETLDEMRERLAALGVTNDHRDQIRLFGRDSGFPLLGTPEGNGWIGEVCEELEPEGIILDTDLTVADVRTVNDPVEAIKFFRDTLNPLADRYGAGVYTTHHERKSGAVGDRGDASAGTSQWSNQPDLHITMMPTGPYSETPQEGGGVGTHRAFVLQQPKGRRGVVTSRTRFELRGEKDRTNGATLKLEVGEPPEREYSDAEELLASCGPETTRKALAEGVDWGGDGTGSRFVKALDAAIADELIEKIGTGKYSPVGDDS